MCDDASVVDIANALVASLAAEKSKRRKTINNLIRLTESTGYYHTYSNLWLFSKYGDSTQLFDAIKRASKSVSADERMGRICASFLPRFGDHPLRDEVETILRRGSNSGVRSVMDFLEKLQFDVKTFNKIYAPLSFPNKSRATGITRSKFLCLCAALQNENVPKARRDRLIQVNERMMKDAYYRSIVKVVAK